MFCPLLVDSLSAEVPTYTNIDKFTDNKIKAVQNYTL